MRIIELSAEYISRRKGFLQPGNRKSSEVMRKLSFFNLQKPMEVVGKKVLFTCNTVYVQ